ncbi:LuxR C-terminal-related transcriptional regulator [Epilithonimonas sp.]|uniref:response regulator transcription factor n=1 Tax=Epilithonimonas sp. TaxID=2894511 RepID=UPI00289A6A71|nr:LuxR C-terminal-related transcriptional regulator [Epilithonimonas sp.]
MNKKFTKYFATFLLLLIGFLNAKDLNIKALEKEITKYNREGKQKDSQKRLFDLLLVGNLTKEEKANVFFYIGTTYRTVDDYVMCIDYLNRSYNIAKKLPKDNALRMKLDYEYAFAYFDSKEFDKSSKMMSRIANENYINAIPENQSYILLQEGYLFLRENKFDRAELKYEQAFDIMETVNYCNLPVILVKMMDLYNHERDLKKVEGLYAKSLKISKHCGILKYQVFAAEEMERIYKENNLLKDAYFISLKIDSLKKIVDLESKVSEMHLMERKYIDRHEALLEKSMFWEKISAVIVAFIMLSIIVYSFRKSENLKTENQKMEEEIELIKEDLNSYSESFNTNEKAINSELAISNLNKLNDRQNELVKLMADGLSNKEIADKLFITESTVKYHIKNIYSILDLKDRKDFFTKINNIPSTNLQHK